MCSQILTYTREYSPHEILHRPDLSLDLFPLFSSWKCDNSEDAQYFKLFSPKILTFKKENIYLKFLGFRQS